MLMTQQFPVTQPLTFRFVNMSENIVGAYQLTLAVKIINISAFDPQSLLYNPIVEK